MYIKLEKNRTWTHGGTLYQNGVHKVDHTVADRAHVLAKRFGWNWLTVHDEHPGEVTHDPNARAGTLTAEDVALGSDAAADADKKAKADAVAAAVDALTKKEDATKDEAPKPFECEEDGCDKTFPSKSALKRHVTMNHKEDAQTDSQDSTDAPEKDATEKTDGDTVTTGDDTPEDDNTPDGDDTQE